MFHTFHIPQQDAHDNAQKLKSLLLTTINHQCDISHDHPTRASPNLNL
jgi:hypothetical protein